ncbi:hypothetical protein BO221_26550 [Archangium sp. Cb G35]|uniref:non-ribosomal peptide synthetase n=1 Tax=Archangium sp. Cb G35 TaxID=1920190 RepID=UPI00093794D2|nr:non-ribosomal peptide synthetase [Archangium sp. Cb G35]OJT21385.1 hypothetical protein BO221_26550 [Archangium sp. Cb G35]
MKDIREQLEKLTPKQRALYELMLKEKARPRPALVRRQGPGPAQASFPQQRLWVLQQLEPDCSFAYNVHITVRFTGPLDVGVLERSFNEVVRRHESLRTTLGSEQGAPVLVLHPEVHVPLPVIELGALPRVEQQTEVERRTREESLRPFDMERAPLMRGTVLRLAADDHVVLVTMHHMVTDRWSLGVLVRELMALYAAFSQGQPSPLPELPVQYSDYAAWQREQMRNEQLREQLSYWKRQLTPLPPPLELPTDRPRPSRKSYRGSREFIRLPVSLTRALKAVAQQQDCTLFMLLLAAFKSVLYRSCGQTDISVGSPIANRKLPELELLIGFFVNTLVLRTDLGEDPTFRALLQRVRSTCLQAYSHQDLPFEQLVEELHPERHLNRNPLFQVMFSFQNTPRQDLAVRGLGSQYLLVDPGSSKFDLLLELREEVEDEITGWLEYDTDLFDGATLARMHGHLLRVLERVAVTQEDRLSALPLLSEAERHQLLVEWSGPRRDYPLEETLHARVEAQVERSPHAVAVSFEGHLLTYRELNTQANRLAWHLRGLGAGPESRVAVCLERSTHLVVALLATLKAGAAYVPLDPGYPPQRLEWMLEDARPQVLLTQRSLLGGLPARALPTVLLDTPWDEGQGLSEENPPPLASPGNLAYVIFTSGSTGRPKGAMNTHRAISNRLLWMQEAYALGPGEGVLQKTPFSFDVSVWEFFWPLLVGARLVVARPGGHQDTAYLASLIHAQQISTLHFVPPMLQAFLQEPELERTCASVRRIICSGEALPAELSRRCLRRLPQAELHNLYGPTEAAVDVTAWACQREDERPSVPIGRPIANTFVRVLDAQGGLVPVGVPGELYLGGVQVGRGYLGRPELTAERFVSDPYGPTPEERLYRTGDLARWLPDGSIDFLGRMDFQVKVRGLRIELGEVESALLGAPGVREAVVVAREDVPGDKRLVGYVVPQSGHTLDVSAVRTLLQQRLPEYMVPWTLVVLPALPLSPNGKVERKALPAPRGNAERKASRPPQGPVEQTLARIWSEVLRVETVGAEDDFFALGGHSLLGLRVVSLARREGLEMEVRQLFQHPTLAALAATLSAPAPSSRPPLQAGASPTSEGDEELPLSPNHGWYVETFDVEDHEWGMTLLWDVPPGFDPELLRASVALLFEHHDVFRWRLYRREGRWAQRLLPSVEVPGVEVRDVSGLTPQAQRQTLVEAGRRLLTGLNLVRGPLLSFELFRLGGQGPGKLLICIHHCAYDAYSLRVFFEDLSALYRQLSAGQTPRPLEVPTGYRQYLRALRDHGRSGALEQARAFWLDEARLRPLPPMPVDMPGGRHTDLNSRRLPVPLPRELLGGLRTWLGAHPEASLNDVLLYGLARAYVRWAGTGALRLDVEHNGRTDLLPGVDLLRTMGSTTLKVPVLLEVTADEPPGQAFARVRRSLRETLGHALGHGLLRYGQHEAERQRLASRGSPQVFFNNRGVTLTGSEVVSSTEASFEYLVLPGPEGQENPVSYELMVECDDTPQGPVVTWVYSSALHRDQTMRALAGDMLEQLRALLEAG